MTEKNLLTSINFQPLDMYSNWVRCSLTANLITQMAIKKSKNKIKPNLSNTLSSIINEFLEQTISFTNKESNKCKFTINLSKANLIFSIQLNCDNQDCKKFRIFMKRIWPNFTIKDKKIIKKHIHQDYFTFILHLLLLKERYSTTITYKISEKQNKPYNKLDFKIKLKIKEIINSDN